VKPSIATVSPSCTNSDTASASETIEATLTYLLCFVPDWFVPDRFV
jgi:hypothetical protein